MAFSKGERKYTGNSNVASKRPTTPRCTGSHADIGAWRFGYVTVAHLSFEWVFVIIIIVLIARLQVFGERLAPVSAGGILEVG